MRQPVTNYKTFKPGDFVKVKLAVGNAGEWKDLITEVVSFNPNIGIVTFRSNDLIVTLNNHFIELATDAEALQYRLTRNA